LGLGESKNEEGGEDTSKDGGKAFSSSCHAHELAVGEVEAGVDGEEEKEVEGGVEGHGLAPSPGSLALTDLPHEGGGETFWKIENSSTP
jgi:hypothetical protein